MNIQSPKAFAYGVLTISNIVKGFADFTGLDADDVAVAQRARLTCNSNALNYTLDGTAPTTSAGHTVAANITIEIDGNANIANFQLIRSGGSDATVAATLFR